MAIIFPFLFNPFKFVFNAAAFIATNTSHSSPGVNILSLENLSFQLAARDEERASVVFRKLLRRPGFDWARDGEELLRVRKPQAVDRPHWPSIIVIPDRLVPYVSRPPSSPPQR